MSDKLFVRDIMEQVGKLDPRLPTNIVSITTGSFPDMTRVHLLDAKVDDEESLNEDIVALKRQRTIVENEVKQVKKQAQEAKESFDTERLKYSTQITELTERLRKVREQGRQRVLPLP